MLNNILWIIAAVVFSVTEILTFNMVTIWFVAGSVSALVASLFGGSFYIQLWVFTIVSVSTLIFAKPLLSKKIINKKISTNADRIIGLKGIVTDEISSEKFAGKVKIEGQEWSAISVDGLNKNVGDEVTVKDIKGVRLIVE